MNLISVSELVKQSWQLYKNNFKTLISITAWLLPFVLLQILLLIPAQVSVLDFTALLSFLVSVASIVTAIVISIILIQINNKIYLQESIGNWRDLIKPAIQKAGGYVLVVIITAILVIIGLVLLIIPGIIMAVWYSFSEQVFVLENIKGYKALKRSKELVSGYWWPVLGRWLGASLFFGIIIWIISIIVSIPFGINKINPTGMMNVMQQPTWQDDLISGIISIFVTPLFIAIGVILYNNLKQIKDASPETQPIAS